ncbi:MAG: biotin synthase BioB [Gammaproteobacteria bacterium]|nr:MAG: biotin synthase BioB [Gammaproteobacteria bacterium]
MDESVDWAPVSSATRHDWTMEEVSAIYPQPFNGLLFLAQQVHRRQFDANEIQLSQLMSIKTGGGPEDCGYCPQSAHYPPGRAVQPLADVATGVAAATKARAAGATRFCMGAAWRSPPKKDIPLVLEMVSQVKALGMETCATLGMLSEGQARELKHAGLDYYNHNLDTSAAHYPAIVSTRGYADRLETLAHVRDAGLKVCCGGLVGMGEAETDRLALILELATLPEHPDSVPVNVLVPVEGTPLEHSGPVDPIDLVRLIALARVLMPASHVRLSAGREGMSEELHALCFLAGANSIFSGDKLLTADNAPEDRDAGLFAKLGLRPERGEVAPAAEACAD